MSDLLALGTRSHQIVESLKRFTLLTDKSVDNDKLSNDC